MKEKNGRATNYIRNHMANPFLVLELPADSPAEEVERKGRLLLSMLEIGAAGVSSYETPFGPSERTAEMVREAMAELRDPDRRLIHEWWAVKEEA
jgi:hypothetical protein